MSANSDLVNETKAQEDELLALKSTQPVAPNALKTYVFNSGTYSETFLNGQNETRKKTFRFRTKSGYHFFQASCTKYETYHTYDGSVDTRITDRIVVQPQSGNGDIFVDINVSWGMRVGDETVITRYAIAVQTDAQGTLTLL